MGVYKAPMMRLRHCCAGVDVGVAEARGLSLGFRSDRAARWRPNIHGYGPVHGALMAGIPAKMFAHGNE